MLQTTPEGYFVLPTFARIPHLVHAFSSRQFGSMNPRDPKGRGNRSAFFSYLGIPESNVFSMNQMHTAHVVEVRSEITPVVSSETDGLWTKESDVYLASITADCVPIIIYDRERKTLGIIHAGWKGVYEEIVSEAIRQLLASGTHVRSLLIGLGPSIRSCCYTIGEDRADAWRKKYKDEYDSFLSEKGGIIHLSLQNVLKVQLQMLGFTQEQLDDAEYCTKDHYDTTFSYRAQGEEQYMSEFITIIGRK